MPNNRLKFLIPHRPERADRAFLDYYFSVRRLGIRFRRQC
jgi:hypothetical protein